MQSLSTIALISVHSDPASTTANQNVYVRQLGEALSRLGSEFAEKHQEVIEALTRGIVNKILHEPMVQLKAQQDI